MTLPRSTVQASKALRIVTLAGAALFCGCGGTPQATQAPAADPAADMAEKIFSEATHKGDAAALGSVLDANFVWISANGETFGRADTLKAIPKVALADETGADLTRFTYSGVVRTVTVNSGKTHVLRIWGKQPEGWRALVYQEVESRDTPLAVTPGTGANCDNPCKNIPFVPQNDTQKDVSTAYKELESAVVGRDATLWATRSAYEFVAASSNMTRTLDKTTRVAQLEQKSAGELAPTPLVSGTMQEFPGVVVMRSKHQPDHGNPLEVTRVWIRRNSKWIITVSFQTAVQPS